MRLTSGYLIAARPEGLEKAEAINCYESRRVQDGHFFMLVQKTKTHQGKERKTYRIRDITTLFDYCLFNSTRNSSNPYPPELT